MVRSMYRIFPALTAAHLLREPPTDGASLSKRAHHGPEASVRKQVTSAASGSPQAM